MISCKEYVALRKEALKKEVEGFESKPHLVVFQVGDDAASNSYIRSKQRACDEVGVKLTHVHIDENETSQADFEKIVCDMDNRIGVDGIIIQLPIPEKYDVNKLQNCISKEKDVDGFKKDSCFEPCTPLGVINWLEYNDFYFTGMPVVVAGRSKIVGKPLVNMLIDRGSTVTCINSKTDEYDVYDYTGKAYLFISAIGKPKYWNHSYFRKYMCDTIVDVGINRDENGKLCGDIDTTDFNKYLPNTNVTPVPGGVGILTVTTLVENTVKAYKLNGGK